MFKVLVIGLHDFETNSVALVDLAEAQKECLHELLPFKKVKTIDGSCLDITFRPHVLVNVDYDFCKRIGLKNVLIDSRTELYKQIRGHDLTIALGLSNGGFSTVGFECLCGRFPFLVYFPKGVVSGFDLNDPFDSIASSFGVCDREVFKKRIIDGVLAFYEKRSLIYRLKRLRFLPEFLDACECVCLLLSFPSLIVFSLAVSGLRRLGGFFGFGV